ncbi:MAG: hypothetical protein H7Y15_09995, partial [Pseudonocardia sp.]|nr:hypothetical protein [Pseudonocardia sp.]
AGVLARQPVPATGLALVADPAQATGWAPKDLLGMPKALLGAVAPTRYVGATSTPTAPNTGTFAVGDFVVDSAQHVWVCSVAGSPGTWVSRTAEALARLTAQEAFEHYGYSGSGTCAHGAYQQITGWPTAGVNNSARMTGPNGTGQVVLGRAGRWAVRAGAYSDHSAPGYTQIYMTWPDGPIRPMVEINDGRWHGGGFAGAGQAWQWATWTGWVTAAEAALPIKLYIHQVNTAASAANFTYQCSFDYMGGA